MLVRDLDYIEIGYSDEAIAKTAPFFHTMGMETQLRVYNKDYEKAADCIVNRFEERGWKALGERQNITLE